MRTILDAPLETLDSPGHAIVAKVRADGFFRAEVFGDSIGPSFSYSTGIWVSTGQPEILMFSMKEELAHDVFWNMFRLAKANTRLSLGTPTDQVFQSGCLCISYSQEVLRRSSWLDPLVLWRR